MKGSPPDGSRDRELWQRYGPVAGVDEAGRGALAGPVVVAAVILHPARLVPGLDDSKRLSPRQREKLAAEIREKALAWAVAHRSPEEIDRVNILEATRQAMVEAVAALEPKASCVVSDAVRLPVAVAQVVETQAEGKFLCVAAASILAKVTRDQWMQLLEEQYPGYGLAAHKGYPVPQHLAALAQLGPAPCHRRSFAPVRVLAFW